MTSEWEQTLDRAVQDIRRIYTTYESADILIREALQTAVPWVTMYMSRRYTPSAQQLLTLGTQLVAIGIAQEMASRSKKAGFI